MWYRQARKFNLYGQPIGDSPKPTRRYKTKRFQSTDEDLDVSAEPLEVEENETPLPEETTPETPEPAPVEEPRPTDQVQTESQAMLDRLTSTTPAGSLFITEDTAAEVNPDNIQRGSKKKTRRVN